MSKAKIFVFSAFSPYYFHVFSAFFQLRIFAVFVMQRSAKNAEKLRNPAKDAEICGTGTFYTTTTITIAIFVEPCKVENCDACEEGDPDTCQRCAKDMAPNADTGECEGKPLGE